MNISDSCPIDFLRDCLYKLIEKEGSDLHLKSNGNVRVRLKGEVVSLSPDPVAPDLVLGIAQHLLGERFEQFTTTKEYDTVYVLDENTRFRVNLYYHLDGIAVVLRVIPHEIKSIEELNLPDALHRLVGMNRGLVLITGTTGSGKSTTLAAVIEQINKTRRKHIVTIEDPVEYAHHDKLSIIEQRGIGQHTNSFANALRAAMREDPDIIVVGEMRDVETAESVLHAVNTGQLVFSTLHTLDARETLDRMISMFPAREQNRIRMNLASNLQAVISQRLLRGTDDRLIPAVEMMFRSPRIEYLIRSMRDVEILDAMAEERHSFGSVTFNAALFELCLNDKITEEVAYNYATSPSDLKLMFTKSPEYAAKMYARESGDFEGIEIKEDEENNNKKKKWGSIDTEL